MVTSLHDTLNEIPGGDVIAVAAVDHWIAQFQARTVKGQMPENFFGRKLHPKIQAEFAALEMKAQADVSALDACEYMIKHSGWGERQVLALKSASPSDFEALIRTAETGRLKYLLWRMIEMCAHKRSYEAQFGPAMDNFALACRSVVKDGSQPRLAKLIRFLFAEKKVSHLIEHADPADARC
ncbi:hypothetical protein D3C86_1487720 [compost metagenome]